MRTKYLTSRVINDVNLLELVNPFGKILRNNKEASSALENAPISDFNKEWPLVNENILHPPRHSTTPKMKIMNLLTSTALLTTYSDCLKMALMLDAWYNTYLDLLIVFGLPQIEPPLQVRNRMKKYWVLETEPQYVFSTS